MQLNNWGWIRSLAAIGKFMHAAADWVYFLPNVAMWIVIEILFIFSFSDLISDLYIRMMIPQVF